MPGLEKTKVLLLETVDHDAKFIIQALRHDKLGEYDVLRVKTKPNFLAQIKTFQPDVILITHTQNHYGGLQALVDAQNINTAIPFVMVAEAFREELAGKVLGKGIGNYVLKDRLACLPITIKCLLERKQAAEEANRRIRQLTLINEIGQSVVSSLDVEQVLVDIVDAIPALIDAEYIYVLLLDEEKDELIFRAVSGGMNDQLVGMTIPVNHGIAGEVLQSGKPILVSNTDLKNIYRSIDEFTGYDTQSLVALPIKQGGEVIGVMEVVHSLPDAFNRENQNILETAATWISIALKNAHQHTAIQRNLQESQALSSISAALNKTLDLDEILQLIVEAANDIIPNVERAVIHSIDEGSEDYDVTLVPVAVSGPVRKKIAEFVMRSGEGVAGQVLKHGKTINIRDTRTDSRFFRRTETSNKTGYIRSLLVAPIQSENRRLGTISVNSESKNAFSQEDERLLTALGVEAALAIENAQLIESERLRRQEAETLRNVTNSLISTLDLEEALEAILEQLAVVIPYDSSTIFLWEGEYLRAVSCRGIDDPELILNQLFPADSPLFIEIMGSKKPVLLEDAQKEERFLKWEGTAKIRNWIGVPLIAYQQVLGYITIDNCDVDLYSEKDVELAQAFANQAAVVIENARVFDSLQRSLQEANTLYYISNRIILSPKIKVNDILNSVTNILYKNFDYYHVHCYLFNAENNFLLFQEGSGPIGKHLKKIGHKLDAGEGIVGHVAKTNEMYMTNDVNDTPFYYANPHLPETKAELAVPLRVGEEMLGVLDVQHSGTNIFDEKDIRLLNAIADQIAAFLDKAMLYSELQKSLEKEKSARDQLVRTETLAAMGRLVASVAHELNNPLQAIRSALYLIQTEENLSPQSAKDLQVAVDETKRMSSLIGRLRETSRPADIKDDEFQPGDLNPLVIEIKKLIATHLRHNEITFTFHAEENLPPIPMIRDRLKQVILNLCINAVECMRSGGKITIVTKYLPNEKQVLLSINDTGPGIEPEVRSRIFEPFFTTKKQGTGLGLHISFEIVQNHQGQLQVKSEIGHGTTFELLLPVERV